MHLSDLPRFEIRMVRETHSEHTRICLLANATSSHTQRWATALAQRGFKVDVLSIRSHSIPGVRVHTISVGPRNSPSLVWTFASYVYLLARTRSIVRQLRADVINAHYSITHGLIAALSRIRPVVLTVWGSDVVLPNRGLRTWWLSLLNRIALRHATVITSSSRYMADQVSNLTGPGAKIVQVPFGVDTKVFKPSDNSTADSYRIGFLKALHRRYGAEDLIMAFSKVAASVPNAELRIAGDGPQADELMALTAGLGLTDRVHFVGHLPHRSVPSFLSHLDVLVNPTVVEESFGVAVLEASATGLPVVATRVGGVEEVLLEGQTGLFVPPGDPDGLAKSLIFLAQSEKVRREMGREGREWVVREYEWRTCVDQMVDLLCGAVSSQTEF